MTTRLIAGIILFGLFVSAVFLYILFVPMMVGEINRKREGGNLVSYFGFTPANTLRIFREYRRLYPDGNLHIYALAFFGVGVVGLIFVAVILNYWL